MDIEVRFVGGCPNVAVIRQRLADALNAVGRGDVEVRFRAVRTEEEAGQLGFIGSPTILIDGCDPFQQGHAAAGLSCRLYPNAHDISGAPSIEQLTTALLARDPG